MNTIKSYFPGLLLASCVALISKGIALIFPSLGAATFAILIGIFLGNTFFKSSIYANGTKFSESNLLAYSIVLLGGTITFQTISLLGGHGLLFIMLQMTGTIFAAIYLGRKLAFSQNIRLLMASGNAVCGSSAIASTAPVIDANEEDRGLTITIVNLMGTVLMLILPLISLFLYQQDTLKSSALIGGVLQSVGQVVASGSMVNPEILAMAMIFKIVRILFLVVVVYAFGRYKQKTTTMIQKQSSKKMVKIPWYVIGFFIVCFFRSIGFIPEFASSLMHSISSWFEIIALAGIGLRLNFSHLLKQGNRLIVYGLTLGTVQVLLAMALISLLF